MYVSTVERQIETTATGLGIEDEILEVYLGTVQLCACFLDRRS